MFLAMDCDVELYKGGILPLQEYAQRPYDRDILVRLIVKKTPMQLYYQSVRNSQTDIPVLTCAAARMENGDYSIVIGARRCAPCGSNSRQSLPLRQNSLPRSLPKA